MEIDLEQIKANYLTYDDDKIEYIAKYEINSLRPEVISILKEEIRRRGLDTNLNKGIEAQTKELSETELEELKSRLTRLACPECGEKNFPLIGTLIREVKSIVLFTIYQKTSFISCKDCAEKRRRLAIITTAILGWWGIPFGIFRTPQVIIASLLDKKRQQFQSDAILNNFVIANIGEIKTNWHNEDKLTDFIRFKNNSK